MTKQLINIGSVVDDFTGDYLRKGGQKINDNMNEIYDELGDQTNLHPAGAWKTFAGPGDLYPALGSQYIIDTTAGAVNVYLPAIGTEIGRVIKLCDPFGSWSSNSVTVIPDGLDTLNSDPSPAVYSIDFKLLSFVATEPQDWKYQDNVFLNRIDVDAGSVDRLSFTVVDDTVPSGNFNVGFFPTEKSINVYLNGVLLHYDSTQLADGGTSEYGSDVTGVGTGLTALLSTPDYIQLRPGIYKAGDLVTVEKFLGAFTGNRTSYRRSSILMTDNPTDPLSVNPAPVTGQIVDFKQYETSPGVFSNIPLTDLGITDLESITPASFQIYYNGVLMIEEGTAGYPDSGDNQYRLIQNLGVYDQITITAPPTPPAYGTDIVTVVNYAGVIGTVLDWQGIGGIEDLGSDVWVSQGNAFSVKNRIISYNSNPEIPPYTGGDPLEINTSSNNITVSSLLTGISARTVRDIMNLMYPLGTVYENASNPANPADYLGFGVWAKYAAGMFSVGHHSNDPKFDTAGIHKPATGEILISTANIPELTITPNGTQLFNDDSGDVPLSACLPDPSAPVANPASLSSISQTVGADPVTPINVLPPYIVSYKWVRIG